MAYTLLDLQTSVQDDLKDSSFSASRITRYLNYAQQAIFNTHLFKFCERAISGALTIGEYVYAQQTDHQSTVGGLVFDPNNTSARMLLDEATYLPFRTFFENFPDPSILSRGMPSYWTEFGNQIYFDRPADKAYTFRQRYYRAPTSLANPTDVPDVPEPFRELLEQYAEFRAEKYRGNHDVAATYKQDFQDGLEDMSLRYAEVQQITPLTIGSARTRQEIL